MPKLILVNPSPKYYNMASQGAKIPPLNLAYIAALTPEPWEIKINDENYEEIRIFEDADLVGITTLTQTANRAYEIAEQYRRKGIPVVLGGIHASLLPDEAGRFADSVVVGEAESVWPTLLRDFSDGKLMRKYSGERLEISKSLRPRRDLLSEKYAFGSIQTSRGCPFDCEFCVVSSFNGNKYRKREAEDVLAELRTVKQRLIFFTDDNLIGYSDDSRETAKNIFRGMIAEKMNKKWCCQTSVNFADEEEVLELAMRSGCIGIFVGFESIEEKVLRGAMNKKINVRKGAGYYYDFIKKVHRYRIPIIGGVILGSDEASSREFENIDHFVSKSGVDVPWPGILTPYPGTRLFKRMMDEGRILFSDYPKDWEKYNFTIVAKNLKYSTEELVLKFRTSSRKNFSIFNIVKRMIRVIFTSWSLPKIYLVWVFNVVLRKRFINYSAEV